MDAAVTCVGEDCSDASVADAACVEGVDGPPVNVSRAVPELLVVFDRAASGAPWYEVVRSGFLQFLSEEASLGLTSMGLMLFSDLCDPVIYAEPLVAIAPIADNLSTLQSWVPVVGSITTSTLPALRGALDIARTYQERNPGQRPAVVLLSDGSVGTCDAVVGDYAAEQLRITREAHEGTPSVDTYVISYGPMQTLLDLAVAGGTVPIDLGISPTPDSVAAALRTVRDRAQPCEFAWAAAAAPHVGSQVVVKDATGAERRFPVLSSVSACSDGGFFVREDPATASVELGACPATCASLSTVDTAVGWPACTDD